MSGGTHRTFALLQGSDEETPDDNHGAGCCPGCCCCPSCHMRCPKPEDCTMSPSLKRKLITIYIFTWLGLAAFIYCMCMAGVLTTVVGNLLTYPVLVAILLLVIMTAVPFVLEALSKLWGEILNLPGEIEAKLWEIPTSLLPMLESAMKRLLDEMEHRIITKLMEMPKEVAHAVTHGAHDAAKLAGKAPGAAINVVSHATHAAKDTVVHKDNKDTPPDKESPKSRCMPVPRVGARKTAQKGEAQSSRETTAEEV
mmetsp:Transcript_30664/g.56032  ORF Transcript_30664/g.56032 Transcript_30664/m.56032 type:complete len:254 (-) Transcript_30664:26-787(-)